MSSAVPSSNPPSAFLCPITCQVMQDPVVDPEGHSYERSAIETWLASNSTSPITRLPLRPYQLSPNFSLRSAIEEWQAGAAGAAGAAAVSAEAATATTTAASTTTTTTMAPALSVSLQGAEQADGSMRVLVSVLAPEEATADAAAAAAVVRRAPVDVCLVVDVSGSMGSEATLKNADGSTEGHGLSVLDVVRHACRTVIESLGSEDRLALVTFSFAATTAFKLAPMTPENKRKALAAVTAFDADGNTNLGDGLRHGLDSLTQAAAPDRAATVLLLTDGQPNVEPPRGHLPMLQRYRAEHARAGAIAVSTFGFGYSLDSGLLEQLANETGGAFAFIPDSGFVGTVFVHALANFLATAARDVTVTLTSDAGDAGDAGKAASPAASVASVASDGGLVRLAAAGKATVALPGVNFGQPREFVVVLPRGVAPHTLSATVTYTPIGAGAAVTTAPVSLAVADADAAVRVAEQAARVAAVSTLAAAVAASDDKKGGSSGSIGNLDKARDDAVKAVAALCAQLRAEQVVQGGGPLASRPAVLALLQDLEGQATEALGTRAAFARWGKHYLRSLLRAHALQACNNFKDPGVQAYGGALFSRTRDTIDALFCALPPPTPTLPDYAGAGRGGGRAGAAPPRSMATFHNRQTPCFAGDGRVLLAGGGTVAVQDVRRGLVLHGGHTVRGVVRTLCDNGTARLVTLPGGLRLTPFHPVRDARGAWAFPLTLAPLAQQACAAVYSFVLDAGHVAVINGVECCTLGHGFTDNAVIAHPYLGTQRVVADLARMPGWAERGLVTFRAGCLERGGDGAAGGTLAQREAQTAHGVPLIQGFARSHLVEA